MNESNLMEAFASYKVKPARRARSAMTQDGDLVITCWYSGFKKAQVEIMRYEEDLAGKTTEIAMALRAHVAQALSNECEVRVIVAIETQIPNADSAAIAGTRTTYYPRKDLVGHVASFDGERFVVEFRRTEMAVEQKLPKAAARARRSSV